MAIYGTIPQFGYEAPSEQPNPQNTPTMSELADIPEWEDEYVDRVSDRLLHNFDLEKDYRVRGQEFTLYGRMVMESQKHFFHPSLNYANHSTTEHLFVQRRSAVTVDDLEHLVEFAHELADEWIDANEEHYSTDFTLAIVAPSISDSVQTFVQNFRDRTLLKYGFYGHYEVNLVVGAPETEELVASKNADVRKAFQTWEPLETESEPGLLGLIARRLQI